MSETETTEYVCMLCGQVVGPGHDETPVHRRAGAAMSLRIIKTMRQCPWCKPSGQGRRMRFARWPCGRHAAEFAECQRLMAAATEQS